MSNNTHPTDDGLAELAVARGAMVRLFASDGVITPEERNVVRLFDEGTAEIAFGRRLERVMDFVIRARGRMSRYGQQLANEAGLVILPFEDEKSKIVPLFEDQQA